MADCQTTIREERAADIPGIREVNLKAFGQADEADLVDRLRESGFIVGSVVAARGAHIVGHILFSRLPIETPAGTIAAVALAPMAVLPELQRQGIGSDLVHRGLQLCRERGESIVVVVGHLEYYPRFGFSAEKARSLQAPFSGEAFMALELTLGALDGVSGTVRYPPPFGIPA